MGSSLHEKCSYHMVVHFVTVNSMAYILKYCILTASKCFSQNKMFDSLSSVMSSLEIAMNQAQWCLVVTECICSSQSLTIADRKRKFYLFWTCWNNKLLCYSMWHYKVYILFLYNCKNIVILKNYKWFFFTIVKRL